MRSRALDLIENSQTGNKKKPKEPPKVKCRTCGIMFASEMFEDQCDMCTEQDRDLRLAFELRELTKEAKKEEGEWS